MLDPTTPKSIRWSARYFLWVLGGILFLALGIWIIATLATEPLVTSLPEVPGLGRGGEVSGLPSGEMEAALERAKQTMYAAFRGAHRSAWTSRLVDWIGFGLTSAITVIAGALGRNPHPGDDPADAARQALETNSTRAARRWVNAVGVIAALASVMIGLSSRLQADSQRSLDQAEKLRVVIATARKDFLNAQNSEDAQAIVTNLDAETRKNE
jgi:hypothetical protein